MKEYGIFPLDIDFSFFFLSSLKPLDYLHLYQIKRNPPNTAV